MQHRCDDELSGLTERNQQSVDRAVDTLRANAEAMVLNCWHDEEASEVEEGLTRVDWWKQMSYHGTLRPTNPLKAAEAEHRLSVVNLGWTAEWGAADGSRRDDCLNSFDYREYCWRCRTCSYQSCQKEVLLLALGYPEILSA